MTPDPVDSDSRLRGRKGAVYLPQKDWNAYQMWADYSNPLVERDLGYAADLGLNSLRVLASYECWREEGPTFFAHVEHFLTACEARGIRPIVVLFEAPPESPPTEENLRATDPRKAFGVHSPSRSEVLQPRNWKGYARSPIHFARRWAQEFAEDARLLATEIMNEPGEVRPRREFVLDALRAVRRQAPDALLTMGTKDVRFARLYDTDALGGLRGLDAYQFHMNLPKNPTAARRYAVEQRELADEISADAGDGDADKPLWCTEWQRTLEEPPSRFAPNLASLAPTMRDLREEDANNRDERPTIDGDFFWSLMLRPAYLRNPREKGRVNGLFHADGAVYSRADAETVAGQPLDRPDRHTFPESWRAHRFPYPGLNSGVRKSGGIGAQRPPDSRSDSSGPRGLRESLAERLRRILDSDEK
ncbi:hypothetical protein [Halorussus lipolyticus]|uniref:hypothetical protein n=1 Tax=Halorussus lipolyticus TaxID=3034024 RepID=UPI0023E8D35B|nr:hypothetical protein [Halorussus sp. DT80]